MRLKIGYLLLTFGLLALVALTLVRLGRERQFYELQLRQQADSIEAGLREKWRSHLLKLARAEQLPKDFLLRYDRSGRILRTPFYPEPGIQLEWAEYREAARTGSIESQKAFLQKALLIHRSWDRALAIEEWRRLTGELPTLEEADGFERTLIDPEAKEAYRSIVQQFESGRDFTFARNEADFDQIFFRTTQDGNLEGFLPSIESIKGSALPAFLAENQLGGANFGSSALEIHFPQFQNVAAKGFHIIDTILLSASVALLALGVALTGTGVRDQRNLLFRRVTFLNQVVHELKTPLAGLRLSAQLIRRSGPSEKNLLAIDESIMRLDRLFDDIVQINRAEKRADLNVVTASEINQLFKTFSEQEFPGAIKLEGSLSKNLLSETGRLRVLLRNLIANGIKYGTRVSVAIRETNAHVEILVRDHGPGVSKIDAPHIFEEFYRAESARKAESGGLGLGLSLVKKLSNELNATVRLANPGEPGAVFVVRLPVSAEEGDPS